MSGGAVLLALAVGLTAAAYGYLAFRRSDAAIAIVVLLWFLTTALRDPLDLSVNLGSAHILSLDLACISLAAVAVGRLASTTAWTFSRVLVAVLVVLVGLHVLRGVINVGTQAAINDARPWLWFASVLAFTATVPGGWGQQLWRVVIVTGGVIAVIALPYFVFDGIHSAGTQIDVDGELINWRPILAIGALPVLQATILAVGLRWPPSRAIRIPLVALMVAEVLLLQHRTVWVASIVVAATAFVMWAVAGRRLLLGVAAACLVCLPLVPAAMWYDSETGAPVSGPARPDRQSSGNSGPGALSDSITSIGGEDSTLSWRIDGWRDLVDANLSASEVATGNPAGTGFERGPAGAQSSLSAHNEAVDAYVRFGLPGAALLIALAVIVCVRRDQIASGTELTRSVVVLLFLSQLVFSLAYSLDVVQAVILGALLSGLQPVRRLEPNITPAVERPANRELLPI